MTQTVLADRSELTELANKLFMYCDARQWQQLLDEVCATPVWFDMTSAGGGEPAMMEATAICQLWKDGFAALDAAHHQAGHYIITVNEDDADIFGYAVATHYKKTATRGNTRAFVGSYDLKAIRTGKGWRLTQFKYNLKYIDGNATLE
jgi:hypothetical protein